MQRPRQALLPLSICCMPQHMVCRCSPTLPPGLPHHANGSLTGNIISGKKAQGGAWKNRGRRGAVDRAEAVRLGTIVCAQRQWGQQGGGSLSCSGGGGKNSAWEESLEEVRIESIAIQRWGVGVGQRAVGAGGREHGGAGSEGEVGRSSMEQGGPGREGLHRVQHRVTSRVKLPML